MFFQPVSSYKIHFKILLISIWLLFHLFIHPTKCRGKDTQVAIESFAMRFVFLNESNAAHKKNSSNTNGNIGNPAATAAARKDEGYRMQDGWWLQPPATQHPGLGGPANEHSAFKVVRLTAILNASPLSMGAHSHTPAFPGPMSWALAHSVALATTFGRRRLDIGHGSEFPLGGCCNYPQGHPLSISCSARVALPP